MSEPVGDEAPVLFWRKLLSSEQYRPRVNEAAVSAPDRHSVMVDWFDVQRSDSQMAEYLLNHPIHALAHAKTALSMVDVPVEPRPVLQVRVVNLPETVRREVGELRERDVGRLVAVRGLVRKTSTVFPRLFDAVFQCNVCGAFIKEPQDEHLVLKEPLECYADQGGGGHDASFKLITMETRGHVSRSVDTQRIDLQEAPDVVEGSREPATIQGFVEEDETNRTWPGDRVTLNGVLRAVPRRFGRAKSTVMETFLDINSIEVQQVAYEHVVLTDEERALCEQIARDPQLFDRLVASFAPKMYGLYEVKLAILLQLFGAAETSGEEGSRSTSHILLLGDPGVAKTRLLRAAVALSPRAVFATATTATKVGLTYTVVKDEKAVGGTQYTLMAGAAVMADRGLLALDEPDKADPEDLNGLLEAMEDGRISVNKAGLSGLALNARFAGLFAANFSEGRYDPNKAVGEQVPFLAPFISRIDYVFILQDIVDEDEDRERSRVIVRARRAAADEAARAAGQAPRLDVDEERDLLSETQPHFKPEFLRKYIAHARRTCTPVLSAASEKMLVDFYGKMRQRRRGTESPVPLGPRQLQGVARMAEQSARARLSSTVEAEDVERAIRIFNEGYLKLALNAAGEIDMDRATGGTPMDMRQAMALLLGVVHDLADGAPPGQEPSEAAICAEASRRGLALERARTYFSKIRDRGRITYIGNGWRPSGDTPRRTPTTTGGTPA